tara:strand:+ start:2047 stop:2592 length:546 start_codon:yes stop_codon:yes gene_type:complete
MFEGENRDQLGSGTIGRDFEADKSKVTGADPNLQVDVGAANLGVEPPGFIEKALSDAKTFVERYFDSGGAAGLLGKGIFSTLKQKFPNLEFGTNLPQKPLDAEGPPTLPSVPVNPIEDLVGSEYVAYGGIGAEELRKQLFPYMNFNQPTQPGIQGLIGQYAGVGKGTGLMTGPFGMSNTQV